MLRIKPLTQALDFFGKIAGKRDQSGDMSNPHGQNGYARPEQQGQDEPNLTDSEKSQKVDEAIAAFRSDSQTQTNGLQAETEGTGPGLKVVLKDREGQVIRQYTGEEFLRIRKTLSKEGHAPGKLIDRKF